MADEKTAVSALPNGTISSNDDILMFVSGGTTKKITWADIIDRIITTHIASGSNVTLSRNAHTLTISSTGGGSGGSGQGFYISDTEPASPAENDIWLHTDTENYGDLDVYVNGVWVTEANMKGADGNDGEPGQDGAAATVDVGTVTTGAAGTNANVTNSGTANAAVLNFTIPRGADGANGANGSNGADGYSISATVTDITGGHRITISSTDPEESDQIINVMDGTETIQTTSDNRTVTLTAAGWSGETAPYTQTVTVLGMTASVVPVIGLVTSATVETGIEEQKQWSYITKAVSSADSITFSCYKSKPTIDLTANIKAV